jgi:Surface antigen variable number repeat
MHSPIMLIFCSCTKFQAEGGLWFYTSGMPCCRSLRLFGLAIVASLLVTSSALGQVSGCTGSAFFTDPAQRVEPTKIHIVSVEFAGDSPLSEEDRSRFAKESHANSLVASGSQIDASSFEPATEAIRENLMDRGYFRVLVTPTPFLVRATPQALEYALQIQIESGPQYHAGSVRVANADPDPSRLIFDSALLRQKIPLDQGDIFDVSKLRDGLRAITRIYADSGYIDATIEPEFDIRDAPPDTIDVLLHVSEGITYRLETIRSVGLDPRAAQELQSRLPQKAGEVFNNGLWVGFFEKNKSLLPPNASRAENLRMGRNANDGTLDIVLDFRRCAEGLELANPFADPEGQRQRR